ncbi:hypothetical protein RHGRI_005952 [Rhododendron griersonianum]|uniref:Uncharacterized protein n=1 Tax=Rhododendron griersonianum TaxID=479676 RepID=A0AAV6LF69_9ERIC|nr:hypothetical protein RHGRI_005952 [Rhododendron griersonianum]
MYNNSDGVIHWHSLRRFHGFVELVLLFDMSWELFHVTQMPEKYNAVKAHHRNPLKSMVVAVMFIIYVKASISRKSEICEAIEEGDYGTQCPLSNHVIDELIRSQYLLSEAANMHSDGNYAAAASGNSGWRRCASPVRQWAATLPSKILMYLCHLQSCPRTCRKTH